MQVLKNPLISTLPCCCEFSAMMSVNSLYCMFEKALTMAFSLTMWA